jgi:hypothetical protein
VAIPVVVPVEARVEFHLLGPLQVVVDGTPVVLRGAAVAAELSRGEVGCGEVLGGAAVRLSKP